MGLTGPPAGLSREARALWTEILKGYDLRGDELELLTMALRARDRAAEASRHLEREGILVEGLHGPRANPAGPIERSSMLVYARLMRQLGLADLATDTAQLRPRVV